MKNAKFITSAALIAAIYVVLTEISTLLGLSHLPVQIRFSEAMCILPFFTPAAIPGLFAGCLISNILAGCNLFDIVFGSLATLLGALGTYAFRKKSKFLAPFFPIAANTLIVPPILYFTYGVSMGLPLIYLTVFAGEFVSCALLGMPLLYLLKKRQDIFRL